MMENQGSKSCAFQLASGNSPSPSTSSPAGMVARVARAIQREQLVHGPDYERLARAAIEALREPSAAMLQPACSKHTPGEPMPRRNEWSSGDECPHFVARRRIWRSMIDAATPPPADGEAG